MLTLWLGLSAAVAQEPLLVAPPPLELDVDWSRVANRPGVDPPAVSFAACAVPPVAANRTVGTNPADGRVLLNIQVRRGKVSLVTVAEAASGLDWLTPCLQRELSAVTWPVRRANAELTVRASESESVSE